MSGSLLIGASVFRYAVRSARSALSSPMVFLKCSSSSSIRRHSDSAAETKIEVLIDELEERDAGGTVPWTDTLDHVFVPTYSIRDLRSKNTYLDSSRFPS
jgi:hypothetical protein